MEPTVEESLRILFRKVDEINRRLVIAEERASAHHRLTVADGETTSSLFTTTLDGLEALERRVEALEATATTADSAGTGTEDDADGQWGIGDIILAAEKVEVRKSSKPGASPVICAWFDDPAQARSLAWFVEARVRFDEFTETFSVTFEATRVI